MAAVPYAHIVAQLLESKHPKGSEIGLAPNPKDIVSEFIPVLDRDTYDDLHRSGII
jgi:hypothetical protein